MGDRPTILVVDDEQPLLRLMGTVLGMDYDVVTAASGMEALEKVGQQAPQLVLMDARMPGMDGRQLALALREKQGEDIPIVVISAVRDMPSWAREMKLGFLAKPFDIDELLSVAERYTHVDNPGPS